MRLGQQDLQGAAGHHQLGQGDPSRDQLQPEREQELDPAGPPHQSQRDGEQSREPADLDPDVLVQLVDGERGRLVRLLLAVRLVRHREPPSPTPSLCLHGVPQTRVMSDPTPRFCHAVLPEHPDDIAPDGSLVRVLAGLPAGSSGHFELAAGTVSAPVVHRTVSEIWFVVGGRGTIWRSQDGQRADLELVPGVSLTIPVGTSFQFRSHGPGPLLIFGVTMPPWPGAGEAVPAEGPWTPTV